MNKDLYIINGLLDYLRFIDILGVNHIKVLVPEYERIEPRFMVVTEIADRDIVEQLTKDIKSKKRFISVTFYES